jgi:hypothetical protein
LATLFTRDLEKTKNQSCWRHIRSASDKNVNGWQKQYALINTTSDILTINKDPAFKIKIVGHLSDDAFYQAFSDNIWMASV